MKIDDKILREILQKKIKQVKELPKSAKKEVEDLMVNNYNSKHGDVVDIFNGITPIAELDYNMLYKLMKSLHDALESRWSDIDLSQLNESIYFTDKEIKQFKLPFVQKTYDEDIIFDEWFELNPGEYLAKKSIDDITMFRDSNRFTYNPDTQRDLIEKTVDGLVQLNVDINTDAVNEMSDAMYNGRFAGGRVSININTDINTKSNQLIKIVNGKLIIPEKAQVDVVDGYHTYRAMCLTKDLHPEWTFKCTIHIQMLDTEEANMFILLQDKKTHLKKTQVTRIDQNDESNFIINRLNRNSDSNLKGQIDNNTFYDLNILINHIFNPTKREESLPLYQLLEKNINNLIVNKSYYNVKLTREEWFVYLYCIKRADEEKINFISLIENLDMNDITGQIKIVNNPLIKHYRLLDNKIKEVLKNV